jgi:copper chaperone
MTRKNLSVPDISCEHCERTITGALTNLDGVSSVRVDIPGHEVAVEFDEARVGLDRILDVMREEEYPVASVS